MPRRAPLQGALRLQRSWQVLMEALVMILYHHFDLLGSKRQDLVTSRFLHHLRRKRKPGSRCDWLR